MKYRKLGRTNWNVSDIGYGMWGMAGWTGSDDEEGPLDPALMKELEKHRWERKPRPWSQ
jgi:aryl-alcohol dehydrogenase-like predicted oxidoreductase